MKKVTSLVNKDLVNKSKVKQQIFLLKECILRNKIMIFLII